MANLDEKLKINGGKMNTNGGKMNTNGGKMNTNGEKVSDYYLPSPRPGPIRSLLDLNKFTVKPF